MLASPFWMRGDDRQSEQQLLFDQAMQIQRIFTNLQGIVSLWQGIGRLPLPEHGEIEFAVDGKHCRLQTTLADHLDLGIEDTVDDVLPLLITPEVEDDGYRAFGLHELLADTPHVRERQLTLEGYAAIRQFARIDLRWNWPIQHKRAIIGTALRLSKEINPEATPTDLWSTSPENKLMPRILLASSSPYRRQLLERLCLPFAHQSPDIDETPLPGEHPRDLVERLARLKAAALGDQSDHTLVIGSDQATAIEGEILGKPLSHDRAHQQLARASGRTLVFHTGLAVLDSRTGECRSEVVDFQVRFRPLDAATIDRYLLAEQPYDCAGSFKAEGLGIALFEAMQGDDPTSLIGLPLIRLTALLREAGLQVP